MSSSSVVSDALISVKANENLIRSTLRWLEGGRGPAELSSQGDVKISHRSGVSSLLFILSFVLGPLLAICFKFGMRFMSRYE